MFVDASQSSYGAVAYICKGKQSSFVMAKNRVAPLKKMTLPRLELMAATIGARLLKHIQKSLPNTDCYLWSDSQIVLHWLETEKHLPRFVQNRVNEIKDLTGKRLWKYCPTDSNPADLLTRGITAKQYDNNELWHKGPPWINDISSWPTWNPKGSSVLTASIACEIISYNADHSTSGLDITQITKPAFTLGIHRVMNIERYSTYQKLLRVTSYVIRFINNIRQTNKRQGSLTSSEIFQAEKSLPNKFLQRRD
jgi:hypothetical protein